MIYMNMTAEDAKNMLDANAAFGEKIIKANKK